MPIDYDAELMLRVGQEDSASFALLLDRHRPAIMRFISGKVKNQALSEELFVPDRVLYVVEGTGGNRDFDGNEANPRGQGPGQDQEDVATGTFAVAGLTFPNGPASWLDTNLTSAQMTPFLPGAGTGPKITAKFKA
jgi:hypothetical protein